MTLEPPLLLRDGAVLSLLASIWVMGALRYNPRLFLRHYPKEIREAAPPMTKAERKISKLVGLPYIALLFAIPIYSTLVFDRIHPEADFIALAVHGFGVSMVFNILDLLVLDLLWLGALRPRWAMVPGTESVSFRFNTGDHVRGFLVGALLAVIVGLTAAALALLL